MTLRLVGLLVFGFFLSSCSLLSIKQEDAVDVSKSALPLYKLEQWRFSGRLAVSQKKDAWSANIDWWHQPGTDAIRLSGPLGQGATLVRLTGDMASIDHGDGKIESSAQAQQFISQRIGLAVPLEALRYWVLGVPEPAEKFARFGKGFNQLGWVVEFERMQWVGDQQLPQKITVLNRQAKLKLIIDQWDLENAGSK